MRHRVITIVRDLRHTQGRVLITLACSHLIQTTDRYGEAALPSLGDALLCPQCPDPTPEEQALERWRELTPTQLWKAAGQP